MSDSEYSYPDVLDIIRKEILTCRSCQQEFGLRSQSQLPVCLDCSHTFCFACLTQRRLGMGIFSTISCPTCKVETTTGVSGVGGLNKNETTISLMNILETHERQFSRNGRSQMMSPHALSDQQSRHLDVVENVVITIPQYRRLVTDEKFKQIANRAGCQIDLSIPHISLYSDPPPAVAIITFRGNQMQVNDGKSLFRKFLRDFRPHSFTTQASNIETFMPFLSRSGSRGSGNDLASSSLDERDSTSSGFVRQTQSFTGRAVSQSPEDEARGEPSLRRMFIPCQDENVRNLLGAHGSRLKELSELTGCHITTLPQERFSDQEASEKSHGCDVEVVGNLENISVAIPFIKTVLGRGELAMHKVRQFYESRNPQRQSYVHTHSFKQRGRALRVNSLGTPPREAMDEDTSLFAHGGLPPPQCGVRERRENLRLSSTSPLVEVTPERRQGSGDGDVRALSRSSSGAQHEEEETSSSKSPLPYCLTPPASPPPSSSFPKYFIRPQETSNSELVAVIRSDLESFFQPDGTPTRYAVEFMHSCDCELSWAPQPGNNSITETIRIVGEAINREKAKYMLNYVRGGGRASHDVNSLRRAGECIARHMDCPVHFIPVLIGAGGYTIEDLQTTTCTRILINEYRDEDQPPQICIIGTAENVEDALVRIDRMLVNHRFKYRQRSFSPSQRTRSLPTNPVMAFSSPPKPESATASSSIRKTVSDSGAESGAPCPPGVTVPRRPDSFQSTEESVTSQLLCPGDKVSQLIGKKGSILRELKKMSKCDISIERVSAVDHSSPLDSSPQLVHISGAASDVKAAIELINRVIEVGPVVALNMETVKMTIPHDKVPLVIGQRGITAKEMMRRSGCKIHVNETVDANDNCFIELTGTSEQLSAAKDLISDVLEHGTKALGKRFQKT